MPPRPLNEPAMTFKEFGLAEAVVRNVEAKGYLNATPIQEQAMPLVLM
jgi:superfamily II DNA/RNA helicase